MTHAFEPRFGDATSRSSVARRSSPVAGRASRSGGRRVGLQPVLLDRSRPRPLVDRAVVGDGPRRHVDDGVAIPLDDEPAGPGHLADHGRLDVPLGADRERALDVVRRDDRHHPFLRLAHEDLLGSERGVAERHAVEPHVHAALAGRRQLRRRARQAGAAEVLDAEDGAGLEELERALDQQLLQERVTDLDARSLARSTGAERLGGEHRHAADAVAAGARAVQDHRVADAGRLRQVQLLVAHDADAERIDERIARVRRVEDHLTADVRQAQAVAVAADAGNHAGHHAGGVRRVGRPEPQRVHHRDRAGAHRQDVADDAADAGGRALVRLDVARVVVRLDLERDRVALADVQHAGVLADPGQQLADRRLLRKITELAQVHLARLVRAVLAPHDRVHRQLARRRPPPEDLPDPLVLVLAQPQLGVRLRRVR